MTDVLVICRLLPKSSQVTHVWRSWHILKSIWPWELLPATIIYHHCSFNLCLSLSIYSKSCYFWDMLSFENSLQNRHSLFKLIYRTILIAQYNWVMLLGLSQLFQKGLFWGAGGTKQEIRKGGKEPLLSGTSLLLITVKNIMYTTNLRPALQKLPHFCSRWAWFQRELTDTPSVKKLWTLGSSSKSLIQFSSCLKHKLAFC